jgi:hypothetical protein
MEERMKKADNVLGAAAAGESAAFQNENGPNGRVPEGGVPPSAKVEGTAPGAEDHDEF